MLNKITYKNIVESLHPRMVSSGLILLVSPLLFLQFCDEEGFYPKTKNVRLDVGKKNGFLGYFVEHRVFCVPGSDDCAFFTSKENEKRLSCIWK